jgi:hypothetical protein
MALDPCCRHNSAVVNPASPCFGIAMICSSSAEGRALKKLVVPAGLRAAVSYVEVEYQMSERQARRLLGLGRSTHRYGAAKDRDAALRMRLKNWPPGACGLGIGD